MKTIDLLPLEVQVLKPQIFHRSYDLKCLLTFPGNLIYKRLLSLLLHLLIIYKDSLVLVLDIVHICGEYFSILERVESKELFLINAPHLTSQLP